MVNKWKVTAIIFIILFLFVSMIATFFIYLSFVGYNTQYEIACDIDCRNYDYQTSNIVGNYCFCEGPLVEGIPLIGAIDKEGTLYNATGFNITGLN